MSISAHGNPQLPFCTTTQDESDVVHTLALTGGGQALARCILQADCKSALIGLF